MKQTLLGGHGRRALRTRLLVASSVLVASTGLGVGLFVQPASAVLTPGSICHASSSNTNPYIVNAPDFTSQAGGHGGHVGPVWYDNAPAGWGDIIPPFEYVENGVTKQFPGLNWDQFGQDVWANDCGAVYPDLRIVKTSTGDDVVGGDGSYYLNVSNIGNAVAIGTAAAPLVVSDTMPAGVVATSASGTGWDCTVAVGGGSLVCERETDLLKGTSAGQITVQISWVTAGSKSNTATVSRAIGETAFANNTSTVQDDITVPVLSGTVVKTVDANNDGIYGDPETAPVAGGTVKFRAVVTNNSAVTVDVGALTDSYGAVVDAPVTCSPAAPTTLAAGAFFTCDFSLTNYAPAVGASLTNTFKATLSKLNSLSVTPQDTATTNGPAHVLSGTVVKTVDANNDGIYGPSEQAPVAGGTVKFRALITNTSAVDVTLASLTDSYGAVVDAPVTCVPAAPATLAAGASFTCDFTLTNYAPAAGGSLTNTVKATLTRSGSTSVTPQGSATTTGPAHVLSGTVVKTSDAGGDGIWTDDETTPAVGAAVTFRATVTNTSAITVALGALSDSYGTPTTTTITPACTSTKPATLAPGASYTCEFTVANYTATAGGSVGNTFSAPLSATGSNPVTVTDTAVVRTGPVLSGTVVKTSDANGDGTWTADETTSAVSAPATFRATVTNTSGVTVTLGALSDNYGAAPGTTITPTCSAAKPATLAPGASYTCEFTVTSYTAPAGSSVTNTFSAPLSASGSNPVTPTGSAVVRTARPDLALTKTSTGAALTGGSGSYFIDVQNVGGGNAVGPFTVTDTMPAGVVATAVSGGAAWTCQPVGAGGSISCTYAGSLAPGASAPRITVSVTWVTAGDKDNRATVSQVTGETALVNNTDDDITRITVAPTPDLKLTKSGPATRTTGDTGSYSLVVENVGTATAIDVITVTDTLPAGVTAVGTTSGGFVCTVAGNVVTCTTGDDLPVGAANAKTITLPVTFTTAGIKANTATVAVNGDGNPTNNTSTATTSVTDPQGPPPPPPPPLVADLAVKKTGPASVTPGGTASWVLTVTNKGPGNAAGFSVTDTLPAGVTLTSIAGPGFTCTAATAVCTFGGVLLPGQTAAVNVVGSVASTVAGNSIANVVVVGPSDATPSDNTDTLVSVIERPAAPGQADLVLAKSAPAAVLPGDPITWTITVTNAGTADASGFTVTDPLALGLTLVQAVGEGFTCAGSSVVCTYAGTLGPNQVATLLVTAALAEDYTSSSVVNTATAALGGDPTPANNTDTATTAVNQPLGGVVEEPATGEEPTPAPIAGVDEQPATAPARPRALPFTGGSADSLLALAASLSLAGLALALVGRRRRRTVE